MFSLSLYLHSKKGKHLSGNKIIELVAAKPKGY